MRREKPARLFDNGTHLIFTRRRRIDARSLLLQPSRTHGRIARVRSQGRACDTHDAGEGVSECVCAREREGGRDAGIKWRWGRSGCWSLGRRGNRRGCVVVSFFLLPVTTRLISSSTDRQVQLPSIHSSVNPPLRSSVPRAASLRTAPPKVTKRWNFTRRDFSSSFFFFGSRKHARPSC